MPKLHSFILLISTLVVSAAYAQTVSWRGYIVDVKNNIKTTEPDLPLCNFVKSGELRIPTGIAKAADYFTNFFAQGNFCVNNNFTYEVRVRNPQNIGGQPFFDTGFGFQTPTGGSVSCILEGDAAAQVFTQFNVDGVSVVSNKASLVFDLSQWIIFKIEIKNGTLTFYANGAKVLTTAYNVPICNISALNLYFKGSGAADYMRITNNADSSVLYDENFNDCTKMATPSVCKAGSIVIQNNTPCLGDSLILGANVSATTYVWAGPNGYSSKQPRVVIPKTDNTWSGTFYLTAQLDACTSAKDSIKVSFLPLPVVDIGRDTFICNGGAYFLDAKNKGSTYKWQNGTTSQILQVKTGGVYAVTVTDANGCKNSASVKVDFAAASIRPNVTVKRASCANVCDGRLRITSTVGGFGAPYKYKWTGGRVKDSLVDACPGDYGLTVTDSKGCATNLVVTLPSPVPIFIQTTFDTLYNGYATRCSDSKDAAIKVRATGGSGGDFQYTWFTDPQQNTDYITKLGVGNYKVMATDKNNCSDTLSVSVDAPRPIEAFFKMQQPHCIGDKSGAVLLDSFAGGVFLLNFRYPIPGLIVQVALGKI